MGFPVYELLPVGVRYSLFEHSFESTADLSGFSSSYFKTHDSFHHGRIENMDFQSTSSPPYEIDLDDGYPIINSTYIGMVMQGYYIVEQTGVHTFSTSKNIVDNWAYVWVGETAYELWNDDNTNYKAFNGGSGPSKWHDGSYTTSLTKGDAIPVTYLFANGGGSARSNFMVTTPDGKTISDTTGLFAPPCAYGSFPNVAPKLRFMRR